MEQHYHPIEGSLWLGVHQLLGKRSGSLASYAEMLVPLCRLVSSALPVLAVRACLMETIAYSSSTWWLITATGFECGASACRRAETVSWKRPKAAYCRVVGCWFSAAGLTLGRRLLHFARRDWKCNLIHRWFQTDLLMQGCNSSQFVRLARSLPFCLFFRLDVEAH